MLKKGDLLEGTVSGIAFGGAGIVRHGQLVVFIPFTVPGDHISYRITESKKNYARGELVKLEKPSDKRITPACPYFGECGGCQLQHIDYQSQTEYKRQFVQDALKRIGRLAAEVPIEIVPAKQVWAYRRHITLTLKAHEGLFQMGYIATDGHSLLPVKCCPIFVPMNDPVIVQLHALVLELKAQSDSSGRVTMLKHDHGGYILTFHFDRAPDNADAVMKRAMAAGHWKGIIGYSQVYGEVVTEYQIDGIRFQASPEVFIQNHPEQSLNIYMELCRLAQSNQKVLDLYCGIGISSLLLAKRGVSVVSIEGNPEAIRLAQQNAVQNSIKGVKFVCGDVKRKLSAVLKDNQFDCIILNPPRTGADPQVIDLIRQHRPKNIIYISCMPSTLARDLSPLCKEGGYRLATATAFDMFPQTTHVETLAALTQTTRE
jgi:23S rRNA (uracil1939-C5)-methyltransferase